MSGGSPNPRKLSAASAMIHPAHVDGEDDGDRRGDVGSTWRKSERRPELPIACAAWK